MSGGTVGELKYGLGVDASDLEGALGGALGSVATKAAGLVLGLKAVQAGLGALADYIGDSVSAASEADAVFNDLSAAFHRSGVEGAQAAAEEYAGFADEVQNLTGLSGEAVQKAGTLAVSFGVTGRSLRDATMGAADMAKVMGMDLDSAMSLIVRSADSGKNALSRYGIAMSDSASESERLDSILQSISDKFGGAAAAATQTYAGRLQVLKEAWGDSNEETGRAITQNEMVNAVLVVASQEIQKLTKWTKENRGQMSAWITQGWGLLVKAADVFITGLEIGGKAFAAFKIAGNLALGGVIELFNLMVGHVEMVIGSFAQLAGAVGLEGLGASLGAVHAKVAEFRSGVESVRDTFFATANEGVAMWNGIGEATDGMRGKLAELDGAVRTTAANMQVIPDAAKKAADDSVSSIQAANDKLTAEIDEMLSKEIDAQLKKEEALARSNQRIEEAREQAAANEARRQAEAAARAGEAIGVQVAAVMAGTATMEDLYQGMAVMALDAIYHLVQNAIAAYAAKGAAAAAAANASIPVVGPAIAAAAAGVMFALIRGFMTKFHDGGWVGGSSREVPALLERGEYVESREEARALRGPRRLSRPRASAPAGTESSASSAAGPGLQIGKVEVQNPDEMSDEQVQRWLIRISRHAELLHKDGLFLNTAPVR